MKIEDVTDLLEEIGLDEDGYGYIDCTTVTEYTDNSQYKRILAAIKQNIALQRANAELTKKLEEVEKQKMESLLQIEKISKVQKEQADIANSLIEGVSKCIRDAHLKDGTVVRIGDYIFRSDGSFYYEPIKKVEPIKLEVIITENSDKNKICPICKEEMGEYPAISRRDNKTEICSHCGMLEALEDFYKANKGEKTNE